MNIGLPNTIYTAKFTDKTVLAYVRPDNTSFEDSKELPTLKELDKPPHTFVALLSENKQAKHHFPSMQPTPSSPRLHSVC